MPKDEFGITEDKNIYWAIHRTLDGNYDKSSWIRIRYYQALKAITFLHKPSVNDDNCSYCLEFYPCQTTALIWSELDA
jgi:hypothetical protein